MGIGHRKRPTRLLLVAALAAAAVAACGLDITGKLDDQTVGPDASRPGDAAGDAARDAAGDVTNPIPGSDGGSDARACGTFCDPCDPALRLCLPFEGFVNDGSPYAQAIDFSGPSTFVSGVGGTALTMNANTTLHVPHGPAWEQYSEITMEMWIHPASLPTGTARAGLVDKDGSFGLFILGTGELHCSPGPMVALGSTQDWKHVACVMTAAKTTLYIDGTQVAEASAAGAPAPTTQILAIGGNAPSGDPFLGDLDGVRIYARAKTAAEIQTAATR